MDQIIAGALFDFAAYLTTLPQPLTVGAEYESPLILKPLEEWAKLRGLSLDKPLVENWKEKADAARIN